MTNEELIAKIKAEIERRMKEIPKNEEDERFRAIYGNEAFVLTQLLSFLSTLESEKPINPDDAMKEIEEKIALVKQRGTWNWVDVDKFMDEVRGRDPEKPMSQRDYLDKEFAIYLNRHFLNRVKYDESIDGFTTFDASDLANHFYELGCTRTAEKYDEIEYNRQRAKESVPKDLEEAADEYEKKHTYQLYDGGGFTTPEYDATPADAFIVGAKWQAEQLLKSSPLPEDTVLFNKGVEEGKRLALTELSEKFSNAYQLGLEDKEKQMMKEAVEADVMLTLHDKTGDISLHTGYLPKELGIKCDDKVRIIIVKED